jgi:acyl-CoA synthetase (AMP-forming)/AMP-acid ligase II
MMNRDIAVPTLGAALQQRAAETPDKTAYVYLGDPAGPISCTYAELLARAQAVAARLLVSGRPGDRVLLLYPPGLDFIHAFLGCALAGAIAVPAPPPNPLKPERSLARLRSIAESARPRFALTTSGVFAAVRAAAAGSETFARLAWIATDELPPAPAGAAPLAAVDPGAVALLQYTSGSTADPKGAALSHGNLAHNVAYFDEGWDHDAESVVVNWLPAFHDLGLVYGILAPLWGGFLGVQMSPIDVIQRPALWLQAVSRYRGTHSAGPNFIYDLCVRKIKDAEIAGLDLSSWRVALTAAEPIRAETLGRFAARFAPAGFRFQTFSPGYGLSEGTCKVTAVSSTEEAVILTVRHDALEQHRVAVCPPGPEARALVACGRPTSGVTITIVDPATRTPVAKGAVGEIWIAGPSVAVSYWNQPAATEAQLRARLAGGDETPHLRTGDLGFLHEGQLYVTGRIKDVIIVRGNNHYPQDLEHTVEDVCPAVRPGCCAAFSYEEEDEERVAVVAEVDRYPAEAPRTTRRPGMPSRPPTAAASSADEVMASIRRAVAEVHGLRVHRVELVRAGTIPKTTSGKIQRHACQSAMLAGQLDRAS